MSPFFAAIAKAKPPACQRELPRNMGAYPPMAKMYKLIVPLQSQTQTDSRFLLEFAPAKSVNIQHSTKMLSRNSDRSTNHNHRMRRRVAGKPFAIDLNQNFGRSFNYRYTIDCICCGHSPFR